MESGIKLVKVNWVDSVTCGGWTILDDFDEVPTKATTVGYLIQDKEEYVTIAQTYAEPPKQVCNMITIPRVAIVEMTTL